MRHAELGYEHVVGNDGEGVGLVVEHEGEDGAIDAMPLHTVTAVVHVVQST